MIEVPARRPFSYPLLAWVAAWMSVSLVVQVSRVTKLQPTGWPGLDWHLGALSQFDGPEYLSIASHGYSERQLVWFPGYPALIRAVVSLTPLSPVVAAVGISTVAGLSAVVLYWRWLVLRVPDEGSRRTALAVLLLYPYAWFLFGVVYSDAVFVALVVAAFVLLESRRYLWAGVLGALATATRPTGLALVVGLVLLAFERGGVLSVPSNGPWWVRELRIPVHIDSSRLRPTLAAPLLSVLGLLAYMSYQWVVWGNPIAFITVQNLYHDGGWRSLLKQQYFDAWFEGYDGRHLATTTFQAVILALALLSVPAVGRRFGWGYAVFVFALCAIPGVSVSTFMGTGRYLIPMFPVFALAGEWLSPHRHLRVLWLMASGGAMLVMAFGFARSWYLT